MSAELDLHFRCSCEFYIILCLSCINYMDLGFQYPLATTMKTSCLVYAYSRNILLSCLCLFFERANN